MWIVQKWKSILELLKTQTILELKMVQPNPITYIIHESWFQRSSIFSLNENQIESPEVLGESIKYKKKTLLLKQSFQNA